MTLERLIRIVAEAVERAIALQSLRVCAIVMERENAAVLKEAASSINGTYELFCESMDGADLGCDVFFIDCVPPHYLAKLALGICDDAASRALGEAALRGKPIFVLKDDCPLHPETSAAFAAMLGSYRAMLESYGYVFLNDTAESAETQNRSTLHLSGEATVRAACYDGNVLSRRELLEISGGRRGAIVTVSGGVLVTAFAQETARLMGIEIKRL